MKTAILSWALALSLSGSLMADDLEMARGDGAGNGGGAWVCQNNDPQKTIRWAKMVDLYEAKKEFLLSEKDFADKGYREIIDWQKDRLLGVDNKLYERLAPYFERVETNIKELDVDLEVIDDSLYRVRPPARDCLDGQVRYIQLANYTHYGRVLVNEYLFNSPKLSETDKAALMFHEAVYAYLRDNHQETDSVRTREVVGYMFSDLKYKEIKERVHALLGYEPPTDRDPNQESPCGLLGSVDERIKDCSYQSTSKTEGFVLVTRSKDFKEIHKEIYTGLLFSYRLPKRMLHDDALNVCQSSEVSDIEGLTWRLPTRWELRGAVDSGIGKALPNMKYTFWSTGLRAGRPDHGWALSYNGSTMVIADTWRPSSVRCVAR